MDSNMKASCGTYCGVCEWREPYGCPGCQACGGTVFWGECDKAKCCSGKGYAHCGQCPDLPCQKLVALFDDQEHGDQEARLNNLKNWAAGIESYEKLR
jgi:hypothetical protein